MRRVVIDTNCLLAILPTHSPYHKVWTEFLEGHLEFCVSTDVLFEYEEILSEKTSSYFADIIIKTLINRTNLVRVNPTWHFDIIVEDPDDNKFVDCALCGQAEYLISNDRHYNILKSVSFPQLSLVKIQDFVKIL